MDQGTRAKLMAALPAKLEAVQQAALAARSRVDRRLGAAMLARALSGTTTALAADEPSRDFRVLLMTIAHEAGTMAELLEAQLGMAARSRTPH